MKKTLVISLVISVILNATLSVALQPGILVDCMGFKVYSKTANNAWAEGYDYGKKDATNTALDAINGDGLALEMFILNAEEIIYK